MFYLYRITNQINNKVYIGQSNKEKERWRQHKYFGRNPHKTNQYIHKAMNKYGIDNFIYEIICCSLSKEDASETEKQLIIQYDTRNPQNGYNISPGGETAWNLGLPTEQQPMYGKKQSKEFCELISKLKKGCKNPHSDESKQKISQANKGRILSKEWKEKLSISNIGIKRSKKTRNAISKSKIGKKFSEETKIKMSVASKGKSKSLEARTKMSKSKMKFSEEIELNMIKMYLEGIKNKELSKIFGCSIPTTYAIIKRYNEKL